MADVAIIYAREDKEKVRRLAEHLSAAGLSVWWDSSIKHGSFRKAIEAALRDSRTVVVAWSQASVGADWVLDEARVAQTNGKVLVPVRLDQCELPLGHGQQTTIDLTGWRLESDHPSLGELREALSEILHGEPAVKRLFVGKRSVELPCFLCSVSSHETFIRPVEALKLLELAKPDAFLLSAYDVANEVDSAKLVSLAKRVRRSPSFVVLDSGNYEAFRKGDRHWRQSGYAAAVAKVPADLVMSFDNMSPPMNGRKIIEDVLERARRDQQRCPSARICPIIHVPPMKDSAKRTELVSEAIFEVARALHPPLVAIPERELGDGLFARARLVAQIRKRLATLEWYQPLHLLGTGNPLSLAVFAAIGADMFDGLEWCRTAADGETGRLYHHQQYDLMRWRDEYGSELLRSATSDQRVSYFGKLGLHNLEFMKTWLDGVRKSVRLKTMDRFLIKCFPDAKDDLEKALPEVFP